MPEWTVVWTVVMTEWTVVGTVVMINGSKLVGALSPVNGL